LDDRYWYIDMESRIFESYMVQEEDLGFGQARLLEVDKLLILPVRTEIQVLITSSDVLHS
jgi:heme/copper-type cytochrome/quinol oxidase subunit 2